MFKNMTIGRRNHILAWSSLWIYVPAAVWLLSDRSVPLWHVALLLLSGTLSLLHWTNNTAGDWRHRLDIAAAVVLAFALAFRLFITNQRRIIGGMIVCGMTVFFVAQRRYQTRKEASPWGATTLLHIIFRYFAFWLAMAVHLEPFQLDVRDVLIVLVILTTLYVLHISWLCVCQIGTRAMMCERSFVLHVSLIEPKPH